MDQVVPNAHRIFVVDCDAAMRRLVSVNLEARGYRVCRFHSGSTAVAQAQSCEPDLIVLDVVKPGPSGLDVLIEIRRLMRVPVMVMSVREDIATKLAVLEAGADDYITKPFRIEEVIARIRAILRRSSPALAQAVLDGYCYRSGDLWVDLDGTRVAIGGEPVHLSQREWATLQVLVKNAGRVVSHRQLLQEAWGPDYGSEGDYVRAYITRLRKKLEPDPQHPYYILLERGLGYRLRDAD